jgi:NAD(P)-dependent dehydrogenase (short-subunit alcohol dehydrogenase family)
VTKHGAVAFAEWLSINYGDAGIRVSCLCPQGVRTPMLDLALDDPVGAAPLIAGGLLDPSEVAEVAVQAIRDERFLILPHPQVAEHLALKGAQPERWLRGMRKLVREARASAGS